MNWGKGLMIGLGLFMAFVIFLVVMMFRSPDDTFDKDYYEKGLAYNDEFKAKKQVFDDGATPKVTMRQDVLFVNFIALDSGKVEFWRPSNKAMDKSFDLNTTEVKIPILVLTKGQWKMIAKWKVGEKAYLYEKNIFIP